MTAIEHPVSPEELMAFLDGELRPDEAVAVHAHVAECSSCARLSGELAALSPQLRAWPVDAAPPTLLPPPAETRLKSGVARVRSFVPRRASVWQLAGVAAVLVVAAVLLEMNVGGLRSINRTKAPASALNYPDVPTSPVRVGGSVGGQGGAVRAGAPESVTAATSFTQAQPPSTPPRMIIRTATLTIITREFDSARSAVDRVVQEAGGFVGGMTVTGAPGEPRLLHGTLRVPVDRLDSVLAVLKQLGHVAEESQHGNDVTERVRDLGARLSNARAAEKRLVNLLSARTGDLADVLAAEREITRVREQIEQLDAERQGLEQQVTYATLTVRINEQRQAALTAGPSPLSWQFHDALVEGIGAAVESAVGAGLFIVRVLPSLALWVLILVPPAGLIRRRYRRRAEV